METEKNEKVRAMYGAVWELLEEGMDPHRIKVSDITERAGIGKGTAYEYFRSKEEIVGKAVQYNCLLQFHTLEKRVMEKKSYREALEVCFGWMTETSDVSSMMLQIVRRAGQFASPSPEEFLCGREKKDSLYAIGEKLLTYIAGLGRSEGLIRPEIPDYLAELQILSQLMGYFVYQKAACFMEEIPAGEEEIEMTKSFLCDNIIKSLA